MVKLELIMIFIQELSRFAHDRLHINIPFAVSKKFESFFGERRLKDVRSVSKIKLPQGHELHGKVRKMQLIEFEPKENFERQAVLIEDEQKNKSVVLIFKDNFEPTNRANVPEHFEAKGETCVHVVYGEASTVGSIEFFHGTDKPFEEAEKIAFEKAKKMMLGCEQSGIRSNDVNNNIQLSGMHVVVIEDPQKPDSADSENIQEAIAFLFGSVGPFKDVVVFPEKEQGTLMEKIKLQGGRTLLNGPNPESEGEITLSQFKRLKGLLKSVNCGKNIDKLTGEERLYLEKAFLSNVPWLIHWHKMQMEDIETLPKPTKNLFRYLRGQLKSKLQTLLDSSLANYS